MVSSELRVNVKGPSQVTFEPNADTHVLGSLLIDPQLWNVVPSNLSRLSRGLRSLIASFGFSLIPSHPLFSQEQFVVVLLVSSNGCLPHIQG